MFNSIQQFETAGIKNLRKAEDEFIRIKDMADFINVIKEIVLHLGLDVIAETLENYDEAIRKSPKRSEKWNVVRKDPKQLITSLGAIQYHKTLFINKSTNRQRKEPISLIVNSVWKSTSASRKTQRPSCLRKLFRQLIGKAGRLSAFSMTSAKKL